MKLPLPKFKIKPIILPFWLKPREIIKEVPNHGAGWWLWFKIDGTTIQRLFIGVLLGWVPDFHLWVIHFPPVSTMFILIELGIFLDAGTGTSNCVGTDRCKQAGNLADLFGMWIPCVAWIYLLMV